MAKKCTNILLSLAYKALDLCIYTRSNPWYYGCGYTVYSPNGYKLTLQIHFFSFCEHFVTSAASCTTRVIMFVPCLKQIIRETHTIAQIVGGREDFFSSLSDRKLTESVCAGFQSTEHDSSPDCQPVLPREPSLLWTYDRLHTVSQTESGSLSHSMEHHLWKINH